MHAMCCCKVCRKEVLIERDMKDVAVVVMSLPAYHSPDRLADCPRLDFPVNEMPSIKKCTGI